MFNSSNLVQGVSIQTKYNCYFKCNVFLNDFNSFFKKDLNLNPLKKKGFGSGFKKFQRIWI